MRLTTKGRYAVTAMLDLALHAQHGPVSLADISERQGISLSYLEQLFAKLRRSSLVSSVRGPGGGYQLSRDMQGIQVAQVIDAVNEYMMKNILPQKKLHMYELYAYAGGLLNSFLKWEEGGKKESAHNVALMIYRLFNHSRAEELTVHEDTDMV